ncbi:hypothetical protein RU09_06025 [Microbacterium sp. MEJ108Y]|uniref:hypothetical protein n=1 Tax=Microbacterium sp. MEJ108Y TaxID=1587523 RepID=UPI0005AC262F|nr:hypothetical protein [Microbacterium sp. MEJ108Y]KIP93368.1 hypothetical protein RU09_06025 [Microbacterium sp. MEJ108Y]
MTLGFSDGAYNLAAGTRKAFGALSDDLVREGLPPMVSRSGDREPADQLRIWYERMTLTPGRRKVYGRKWWQGRLWYQIHPDAVGIPDTSNHEKRRSNDLRAPYNADTAAARRAKELAKRHNITREGEGFRELWHWTFWGPLGTIGAPASTGGANTATVHEEDDMIAARITDGNGVKHHAIIGNGHLRHLIDADDPEWMKNVCTADDRWTDIPIQRLPSVLRSFSCDLHIWDIRNGSFVVLDPLTGIVSAGALWSATNAGRSGIARVEVTSAETAAYIAELAS